MEFNYFSNSSLNEIIDIFKVGGFTDLYLRLSYGIVKNFTNNPKILYALFGFVYGIFSYLSLQLLVKEKRNGNDKYYFIMALTFFSIYPISMVNGVRFNTASLVFFYSIINIFIYNRKVWIIGVLSTYLIHFSFLFSIPFVLLIWIFRPLFQSENQKDNWVFYLFIISFVVSWFIPKNAISLDSIKDIDLVSSSVSSKLSRYNSVEATELYNTRLSSSIFLKVSRVFENLVKVYVFIIIVVVWKKCDKTLIHKRFRKHFSIVLLLLSFGFIAETIPSGGRFLLTAYMFSLYLFYQIYNFNGNLFLKKYIAGLLPVFSFTILYSIFFLGFVLVNPLLWFGNLVWIIYDGIGFTI
jgi:hypothetical protein